MTVSTYILFSIVVFLGILFLLVGMLLGVKAKLVPSGPVKLLVNGENEVEVSSGDTLLSTLSNNKIFLPSACGGGGTCIQCKCIINEGEEKYFQLKHHIFPEKKLLRDGD